MRTLSDLPQTGYVRLSQVLRVYPVSKSTWFAGIRAGRYPAPVKLSLRASGWAVSDIRKLCDSLHVDAAPHSSNDIARRASKDCTDRFEAKSRKQGRA